MTLHEGTATWLGFAARGLVYLLVGWFALDAALRGGRAADNQGAIGTLADEPMGHLLLAAVALGLAGYALWRLTEAVAAPARTGRDARATFRRIGHLVSGIAHVLLAWTAAMLAIGAADGDAMSRGDAPTPQHVETIGRIGYAARGIAFAIVALFFIGAAWRARASAAGGIGDALCALQTQTGGQWLLAITGTGLALFGVYSLVEARYRRIRVDLPG